MIPFHPVGVEAKWRPVYRHLAKLNIGDVVTYDMLAALADVELHNARSHFLRARREMEREHLRTLDCIRGVGYRVVEADEHPRLVQAEMRKSSRRLRRGLQIRRAADPSGLSADAAARLDSQENRIVALEALSRRTVKRIESVEERLTRLERKS